ncbi:Transcription factor Thi1 [Schizosaccharomyces pombe]|uniref:Thiamine repressible genes regulatory protein thi1 n=1 Tax=Schizosaccharomyces pombe (strain 972 / ATCC 24843) TaxID=284812 RepID=THI1_SCHPO|nr:transcription factor Thi1 [Schizosaccharomyces pombe]P36598.2 RecName: Full=Thiamine repressible genes regulatory protein thi1; AltName: Full=Transcription factor ntf1 [Schizosaccharomyces pombe 972h-]CAA54648.1 thi1 [Schizosaccharomyces pombe]CAB62420.2 transcription factor Thi1 [Schizosaccharomyces pombe]|eukprot:NP_594098.2 transcription factor Thi1 [Schizosaccharomyces pombe]
MNEEIGFLKNQLFADVKDLERKKKRRVPPEQRRRVFRACKHCRQKKIKCNGGQPCISCKTLNIECVYAQKSQNKTLSREYLEELSERQLCLEYIFSRMCPNFNLETKNLISISKKLSENENLPVSKIAEVTNELDTLVRINDQLSRNHISGTTEEMQSSSSLIAGEVQPGISFRDQLKVGKLEDTLYLGPTTSEAFIERLQNELELESISEDDLYSKRLSPSVSYSEFDEQLLLHARSLIPSKAVVEFLINSFFINVQTNLFVYHPHFFKCRLEIFLAMENQIDAGFLCILLMVLAFGNQYTAEQQEDVSKSNFHASNIGNRLFSAALSIFPLVLLQSDVSAVQSSLLIGLYLQSTIYEKSSFAYFGLAIKFAVALGLHKNSDDPSLTQNSKELRNRLLWSVFCIDRFVSMTTGRRPSIPLECISIPYPVILPDLEIPGSQSIVENMRAVINLAKLTNEICDSLYWNPSPSFESQVNSVRRIYARLELWKSDLHSSVVFDESAVQHPLFRSNAHVQMIYDNAIMLTTRVIMVKKLKDKDLTAENRRYIQLCVESATRVINIAHLLLTHKCLSSLSFFGLHVPFASAPILLLSLHYENSQDIQAVVTKLWQVLEFLSSRCEFARESLNYLKSFNKQLSRRNAPDINNPIADFQNSFQNWQSWVGDMSHGDMLSTFKLTGESSNGSNSTPNEAFQPFDQTSSLYNVPGLNKSYVSNQPSLLTPETFLPDPVLNLEVDKQWTAPTFLSWTELLGPTNVSEQSSHTAEQTSNLTLEKNG